MHFEIACLATTTTRLEFSLTYNKCVSIIWSSFVVKCDTVGLTCFKAEVLWDCLVNQVTTANETVCLEWPISFDNVVNFLAIPITLCVWTMFFRQVSTVIFNTFDSTDDKWEDTLSDIFKVLFEDACCSIMTITIHSRVIFEGTDFIEVSCFISCFTTQGHSYIWYIWTCCEEGIHVLEVTSIINCCIISTSVMSVCFNIIEGQWLVRVVGHFFLTSVNSNACFGITTVIHTDIDSIFSVWLQAS